MTVPDRPVSGASIESVWGQAVHDRVFAAFGAACTGGGLSVNDASEQVLPIDTATDDPGGWVDTTNNQLVVPTGKGGLYLLAVNAQAVTGAAGSKSRISLYFNGTRQISASEDNAGATTIYWGVMHLAVLAAGDIIQVTARLINDVGANPTVTLAGLNVIFISDGRGA